MICPNCGKRLKVMNTRSSENGTKTVRALFCGKCLKHFYTTETFSSRVDYREIAIEFERERSRAKIISSLHTKEKR